MEPSLVLKYPIDRLPVALILSVSAVDFAVYLSVENPWVLALYWVLLVIPKGIICAWNHHHQHVHTFRADWVNRVYEIFLALHSGITTNLWVLHHNLGHHLNFLDQSRDESGWKRKSGETMGVWEYTLSTAVTAYYRGYQVGRRHPKHQAVFLRWTAVTFLVLVSLVWFRPLQGMFLFVLPAVTSLLFTTWVTYDHHSGLDTDNPFYASVNIMSRPYNLLTGNLGYHTAHHHRQAVHWSKLPEVHASIADQIPEQLFRKSTFDVFFRTNSSKE